MQFNNGTSRRVSCKKRKKHKVQKIKGYTQNPIGQLARGPERLQFALVPAYATMLAEEEQKLEVTFL